MAVGHNFPWYSERSLATVGVGEFVGTFLLVYTIGLCLTVAPIDAVTPLAIAGAIVSLCNVFGDLTGAHFNPCITIALYLVERRFSFTRCLVYVVAEVCGATIGAQVAAWTANGLRNPFSWAIHSTSYSLLQMLACESVFTFVLALTALRAGFLQASPNPLCPMWVAGAVVAASFAGGPISGACINPALAIGWVVADGSMRDLVPYTVGPILGCVAAAAACMLIDPELYVRRFTLNYVDMKGSRHHLQSATSPLAMVGERLSCDELESIGAGGGGRCMTGGGRNL